MGKATSEIKLDQWIILKRNQRRKVHQIMRQKVKKSHLKDIKKKNSQSTGLKSLILTKEYNVLY